MNASERAPRSVLSQVRKFLIVWLFCSPSPTIRIAASIALTSACSTSSHVGKRSFRTAYPLSRLTSVVFCDRIVRIRHSNTSPAPSRVGTPNKFSRASDIISDFCCNSNCFLPRHYVFNIIPQIEKIATPFYKGSETFNSPVGGNSDSRSPAVGANTPAALQDLCSFGTYCLQGENVMICLLF